MRLFTVNEKEYSIPADWNELSKADLLEICRIMLLPLDEKYKRILIFGHFTGIPFVKMQNYEVLVLLEILSVLDYLFQESRLTKNHFGRMDKLVGPEPGLTNFTFEQYFSDSEAYYTLCRTNKESDNLIKLINCMYNYKQDIHPDLLKLSEVEKLAIFFYYEGCSAFIKFKFRAIFKSDGIKSSDGLEFARFVNKLNKGDLSKNEQIKNTNLYEALTYLQSLIEANEKA